MFNYFSLANMTAGFVGMLVGFTSSAVLVFQAAMALGASQAEISSWLLALGLSIAITCIGLSLRYRVPILTGWSTPGAALLITSLSGVSLPEAIGAFMFSAALTVFSGITGIFEKIMDYVPRSLTSAMLAGILLQFGMNVFTSMQTQFSLVVSMMLVYLIGKCYFQRYTVILVLLSGIIIAYAEGLFHLQQLQLAVSYPVFTAPVFSFHTLISIGMPLFIVTMTSQNIPGTAVIRASEYNPPVSSLISWIGGVTFLMAPFGCYAINLAAITAAICMGEEADNNPKTRYRATIFAGFCWLVVGLFSASVVALFAAFPKELVTAIAGLALLSTIANNLKSALDDESQREPALITILVCASGISLWGIGAAFWGLIAGILASLLLNWHKKKRVATAKALGKTV
ncbi:benzoate/H(+) symporter BenE family transporter [Legionella londiniensis]|uniref:Inner membrane protein YdcO n=1 Tax=Legionella londiniensis TaxID=45068 RepID=A0A0W0VSW4_9GAMM|nr:benzoate/H(+) symporter BenE family transporter [Legionella londiniensis]KTD23069.1 Inner membrane protein YdcO [Legionella londiniensis]STX94086.1 Inner membrane protein ydcO [Legionella londiniensis]